MNDTAEFVKIFQQLEVCKDVKGFDIGQWILSDCDLGHQILSAKAYPTNPKQDSSDDDGIIEINIGPSHAEAIKMLEGLMTTLRNVVIFMPLPVNPDFLQSGRGSVSSSTD